MRLPTNVQTSTTKTLLTNGTNPHILLSILRISKETKSVPITKTVHAFILRSGGFEPGLLVSNNLLHSYSSCGSIANALKLFDRMLSRDVVTWNTMISGFLAAGRPVDGFLLFREMVRDGTRPTQSSFASVLAACAETGGFARTLRQVHCLSFRCGFSSDCCVGNALLKGYANLDGADGLRELSEEMCGLDDISVEILLRAYSRRGMLGDASRLLRYTCSLGLNLTHFAISSLTSLCASVQCIELGTQTHGYAIKLGYDTDVSVANSLVTMYSRSYRLEDAKNLFDWFGSKERDIVTWNSLIGGFAYNGEGDAGLCLVGGLLSSGFEMNESTFLSFLSCCSVIGVLENAKQAHVLILKLRDRFDNGTDNIVLAMYCRSNSLTDAASAFEATGARDIVSLNMMLGLYRNHGCYENSIAVFFRARLQGIGVDEVMLSRIIYCCSKLGDAKLGLRIHGCCIRTGFEKFPHTKNSLLQFYSQFGRIDDMERIFFEGRHETDIVAWNHMLMGYSRCGLCDKSFEIWREVERRGLELNEFSYSALLDVCGRLDELSVGEQIHARVRKKGLFFDTALVNSLITMYSNCGTVENALSVFEEAPSPDLVSWNAMVSGYSQNGFAEEAVEFYRWMDENGVEANHMTFGSVCMSCATLAELKLGSQLHARIVKRAFESDLPVANSLITMYARCGDISSSSEIFRRTGDRDVVTWNSVIGALAHHGLGREAMDVFGEMRSSAVRPNGVTFVAVLSACSQAGLVSEAGHCFKSMYEDHGIAPSGEHYACLVDVLCRAGKLAEARALIEDMPFHPCPAIWKTLLSACRLDGDAELGELAARRIMDTEPGDSAPYVLLSNLYASTGVRGRKSEVWRMMAGRGVKKEVGYSWV